MKEFDTGFIFGLIERIEAAIIDDRFAKDKHIIVKYIGVESYVERILESSINRIDLKEYTKCILKASDIKRVIQHDASNGCLIIFRRFREESIIVSDTFEEMQEKWSPDIS